MGFRFVMRFSGLCVFVKNSQAERARVLLVDAGEGSPSQNGNPRNGASHLVQGNGHLAHHEPHAAILAFDLRDMAATNLRTPELALSDGQPRGLCFLKGHELTVWRPPHTGERLKFEEGQVSELPTEDESGAGAGAVLGRDRSGLLR